MAQLVLPRVQAMMLCDGVEESDEESGVFHLTGVRTVVRASAFPAMCPRLCAFVQMSGHRGKALCHIEIERLGTDEYIHHTKPKEIFFDEPVSVVPVLFRMRNCVFPAAGIYYVQIVTESKLIGERPLELRQED